MFKKATNVAVVLSTVLSMTVPIMPVFAEGTPRAIIVQFTSSMTSNILRTLIVLFGIEMKQKRFYTFMASSTLPWQKLWQTVWGLISSPETEGRLLVALDDRHGCRGSATGQDL